MATSVMTREALLEERIAEVEAREERIAEVEARLAATGTLKWRAQDLYRSPPVPKLLPLPSGLGVCYLNMPCF